VTTPSVPTTPLAPSNLIATAAASSAQVTLTWADNSSNETGFKIERSTDGVSFTQIATTATNIATYTDSTGLAYATTYYYRVRATNSVGDSAYTAVASATTAAAPTTGLPAPWATSSIGFVGPLPSISVTGGTYNVSAAGAGIGSTTDSFQFVYQQLTGDGTLIARVAGIQNTSSLAQAGIMMRDGLAASAAQVSLLAGPSSAPGVSFIARNKAGQKAAASAKQSATLPLWLKLVRKANTFSAYRSDDGISWTLIGSQTIRMSQTIYVGLAVASGITSTPGTSTFDNVSLVK